MGPTITRIGFFNRLRLYVEDVFEQAQVRGTTQEAFTQHYERSKVRNGIRRKVVKLSTADG